MRKIKVTQYRSSIGSTKRQKRTLEALGISRIGITAIHDETPQIKGMIRKVDHLVRVEEVK